MSAGVVVVDKPAGMTSHDVVGRCRRIFSTRKVGHAGTLDPMATGVLV
ncbi:MAG: tRNA pseudouridine(55) synthase TruB, partial [Mycobacterium sp.]